MLLVGGIFSCSNEDSDEDMKYGTIYFPLATRETNPTLKFNFEKDTTHLISIYCAGSQYPNKDIVTKIIVDVDAYENSSFSSSTYLLPEDTYSISPQNMNLVIAKETDRADMAITFQNTKLDHSKKYVLPLKIELTGNIPMVGTDTVPIPYYKVSEKHGSIFLRIEHSY